MPEKLDPLTGREQEFPSGSFEDALSLVQSQKGLRRFATQASRNETEIYVNFRLQFITEKQINFGFLDDAEFTVRSMSMPYVRCIAWEDMATSANAEMRWSDALRFFENSLGEIPAEDAISQDTLVELGLVIPEEWYKKRDRMIEHATRMRETIRKCFAHHSKEESQTRQS